jgi:hypothetical protein
MLGPISYNEIRAVLEAAAAHHSGKLDIKKIVSTKADRVMQQFLVEIKKAEAQFEALALAALAAL